MSYVTFCQVDEFRVDCFIEEIDPNKIPATIAWLKSKGATRIKVRREISRVQFHSSYSQGNLHYWGISERELAAPLDATIDKIERLGCCCIIG
jgi:hypothetical protein